MSSPTADLGRPLPGTAEADIQRRRRLLNQWKRRSALVHLMRKVLPAACLGMLAVLGAWTAMNTLGRGFGAKIGGGFSIRMLHPQFQGRNDAGKPFVLVADSALRDEGDAGRTDLDKPVFTLGPGGQDKTVVRSKTGVYHEDTRMLDLHGDVHMDDAKGNHFITEHALIDTQKDDVTGETHIDGYGPLGRIASSSYAVRNGGAYMRFEGRVKSRIEHGMGSAPAKAP